MAEVRGGRFAKLLAGPGRTLWPKSAALLLTVAAALLLQTLSSSAQSAASPQTKKSPQASSTPASPQPTGQPPAQIWLPPVQAPEHTPVIAWDGKLLTIDAENSSLSDLLLAIRSRTGASIEMPASTNRERIAIHLGPAPIREVLSSLLYGTDFNYVILSSEGDESGLGKVIVTARDDDHSDDATVAGDTRSNPKMRLMPGYSSPGKRDFEVSMSKSMDDSSSNVAEAPAAEPPSATGDQPSVADSNATSAPAETQPAPSTADATDSSSSPSAASDSPTLTAAEPTSGAAGGPANNSSEGSNEGGTPTISQMEQNLQHMYQQRQQLQAQQNHPAQTPPQ